MNLTTANKGSLSWMTCTASCFLDLQLSDRVRELWEEMGFVLEIGID